MGKKKTSITVDEDLWLNLKVYCIKSKMDISEYLEKLIKEELKKGER
jgi:hypothetical protein